MARKNKQKVTMFHTIHCPICGETILFTGYLRDYTYKSDDKYFCSWTCYENYMENYHPNEFKDDEVDL